ncbi:MULTISPECIES: hypothetical protein [Ensifer]|uniref:hypothetical protein n=1 Tax=Ensifer TaxID=106591 RepID=UPI00080739E7|nr:hypothetical protein [Ensifer adhaerens]
MTVSKKLRIVLLAGIVGFPALQAAERIPASSSYSFVSTAEARVGRPLTPVSVAGVARRTVRRCAVGVYYC